MLEDAAAAVSTGDIHETWADANALVMEHPMASVLPGVGDRLRMPRAPQRGDSRMPRVAGPSMGASQRMVVSPGFEDRGTLHMPGGQAGHFLSPYWAAGHTDWAEGRPSPFLPGPTVYTLTLTPADSGRACAEAAGLGPSGATLTPRRSTRTARPPPRR